LEEKKDGRTPYHIVKGRKFNQVVAEFGECTWYLKPKSEGKYKGDIRWEEGIWLGIRDRKGETLVGTANGIVKVRSTRRTCSDEEKWDKGRMAVVKGVPLELVPGREGIEIHSRVTMPAVPKEIPAGTEYHVGDRVWRRPHIERRDVEKFGLTPGCPGCVAASRGAPGEKPHRDLQEENGRRNDKRE